MTNTCGIARKALRDSAFSCLRRGRGIGRSPASAVLGPRPAATVPPPNCDGTVTTYHRTAAVPLPRTAAEPPRHRVPPHHWPLTADPAPPATHRQPPGHHIRPRPAAIHRRPLATGRWTASGSQFHRQLGLGTAAGCHAPPAIGPRPRARGPRPWGYKIAKWLPRTGATVKTDDFTRVLSRRW